MADIALRAVGHRTEGEQSGSEQKGGQGDMPISETLRAELGQYLIGPKLRALRLRRSMGLTQLGQRTGLSPALLSKIENAKLVPTIPTLLRMARVYDVTLDYFFQNEHRRRIIAVTRQQEREKAGEERLGTGE